MPKTIELLLTDNVESLGIVGDVVTVRTGYARNFLLPRQLATPPSEEKIKELSHKRAEAEKQVAALRSVREQMVERIQGVEVTLERSCNDQGLLYGSITQQDVATALNALGFGIRPRDVRLGQTIKRIDAYEVLIKPEADLEATVKVWVVSDRPLDLKHHDAPAPAAAPAPEAEHASPGGGKEPKAKHAEDAAPKGESKAKKHHHDEPAAKGEPKGKGKGKKAKGEA